MSKMTRSAGRGRGAWVAALLGLLLLAGRPAHAQFRAAIQGTVTDQTGGTVPNAKVTLLSEETQQTQQVNTSGEGFYYFGRLAPGNYTVSVELPGFQKAVKEHIATTAEQTIGVNLTLTPGEVSQTITVSGNTTPALETENASIDGTITAQQVQRLPQVGRDPYETVRFTPGVFGLGARDGSGNAVSIPNTGTVGGSSQSVFATENGVQVTGNGQRPTANTFEIDGVSVNSQTWGGAAVITPSQEFVKEVRVSSSSYNAETRAGGIAVQTVSQNGTNEFHGSAFFKYDSPSLNAYARWAGPQGGLPQKNQNIFRQFGGSLGGPIVRNKLFAFFTYETLRQNRGNLVNTWIETQSYIDDVNRLRPNSIASQVLGLPGNSPQIVSALQTNCGLLSLGPGECQAVNGGLDIGSIGGTRGQLAPGSTGGGLDGRADIRFVQARSFGNETGVQYDGRVDWQPTQNDRIFFSEFYIPYSNNFPNSSNLRQNVFWNSDRLNLMGAIVWTRTLSSTMVNEARFNVSRWKFDELASNPNIPWGIPPATISFGNISIGYGAPGPGIFGQTTYNYRDTLTKVVGSHSLKFGLDIAKEQNNDVVGWSARPQFDFGNVWNFANDAPIDESGGGFDPRTGQPTSLRKYIRTFTYAGFVQDDWKVRPNLTLNLGLRWDYYSPIEEKFGNISNVLLGGGASTLTSARIVTGGQQWRPNKNNWAPQFGFAYNPAQRLVIRGGFGIGYNRVPQSVLLNGRLNPPLYTSPFVPGNLARPYYALSSGGINSFNGFPAIPSTILQFDPNSGFPVSGALDFAKPNLVVVPQRFPQPMMYRYSLDFQVDLGAGWTGSLGYQGSQGRHFTRATQYGLIYPMNPAANYFQVIDNDVNTNFNALLTHVQKRFSSGFQVQAQYRWSKSIDDGCSTDQFCSQFWQFDRRLQRSVSDFDVKHYFVANALWDIPVFRDRSKWTGRLLGGWEVNGVITASSGFPWSANYRANNCPQITGQGGICPALPVSYNGLGGTDTTTSTFQQVNGNFPGGGSAYFTAPTYSANGLVPAKPGVGRNVFRGPNFFQIDMSASKRFTLPALPFLGENASLDLRVNAFNVFNKLNLKPFELVDTTTQINSSQFGQAQNALVGRTVELQARFSF